MIIRGGVNIETGTILLIVGVFYFIAQGLSLSFRLTRVPDVLILVFIGMVIGPFFKLVELQDFGRMGSVMTVVALSIILFESGTSLKLSTMGQSLSSTLLITLVTAFVTMGVLALGALPFLGGEWSLALLTGAILCGTSSAVVIPLVQSLKIGEKTSTILVLESALTDVICIVLTFALIESMSSGNVSISGVSAQVLKSLGFAAVVGFLGGVFWLMVWEKIRAIPSSVFTTIAFAFILYGIAEGLKLSGAIATLVFGMTLANLPLFLKKTKFTSISENESRFYQEIVFLLKTFFFIYLGVSMHISNIKVVLASLLLVVLLYILRLWIIRFTLRSEGVDIKDATVAAVMIPKGLAPAVLVSLVIEKGIPRAETIQSFVFSVVIFSIIFTALLIPLTQAKPLAGVYNSLLKRFMR